MLLLNSIPDVVLLLASLPLMAGLAKVAYGGEQ